MKDIIIGRDNPNEVRCEHCHQLILDGEDANIDQKIVGGIVVKMTAYHMCCFYHMWGFVISFFVLGIFAACFYNITDDGHRSLIWIIFTLLAFSHAFYAFIVHTNKHIKKGEKSDEEKK